MGILVGATADVSMLRLSHNSRIAAGATVGAIVAAAIYKLREVLANRVRKVAPSPFA
jgi:hypothetical protein